MAALVCSPDCSSSMRWDFPIEYKLTRIRGNIAKIKKSVNRYRTDLL